MINENPKTIVIVEDSLTQALKLKQLLESANYKVITAANGIQAQEVSRNMKPDLIISDIVMPELDGFGLCSAIKKDPELSEIPVVLLTTLSESENILRALEVGADYYLTKPYSKEYMLTRISAIFQEERFDSNEKEQFAYSIGDGKLNIFTTGKKQLIRLLMSTYENAIEQNRILKITQDELETLNDHLNKRVEERTELLLREVETRKTAEENIRKSEIKFRSIIETAIDAVVIGNSNGKIILWNGAAQKIFGYTEDEILFQPASVILPESLHEKNAQFMKSLSSTMMGRTVELDGLRKDGTIFPIAVSLSYWEIDDTVYYSAIIKDITEEKISEMQLIAAKEQAEEMNRLKSSFLANMSHELRTPMIGILGYSEMLLEEVTDSEVIHNLNVIKKSGHRLMETLDLIIDLSVIEAGKLNYLASKVNIISEIYDIAELFMEAAKKKSLFLSVETDLNIPEIISDKRLFRQIINNLINNAVKYTEQGGIRIKVTTEFSGSKSYIIIKIIDTGIGIAKENQGIIWDEFRQVSEGFTRSYEGTGLGLTITKSFIEKLNGDISLESEVGVGSTFIIRIPVKTSAEDENIPKCKSPEPGIPSITFPPNHKLAEVLYVEDDPVSVDLVKRILNDFCNIDIVSNQNEALEKVKQKQYDAVLMDIYLGFNSPNGLATTRNIRQIPSYKQIPIIAITAYAMKGDKDHFLAAGCTHYLSKPFIKSELINTMMDALKENEILLSE